MSEGEVAKPIGRYGTGTDNPVLHLQKEGGHLNWIVDSPFFGPRGIQRRERNERKKRERDKRREPEREVSFSHPHVKKRKKIIFYADLLQTLQNTSHTHSTLVQLLLYGSLNHVASCKKVCCSSACCRVCPPYLYTHARSCTTHTGIALLMLAIFLLPLSLSFSVATAAGARSK